MNEANKNLLKKNYSAWAIQSILENAKSADSPVVAWRIISGKKITAKVFLRVIRKSRSEILIKASERDSVDTLSSLISGAEKINLYFPEEMVLFQSDIKGVEMNGDIRLKFPEMIAQIDRRKHMRLMLDEQCRASVKFQKEGRFASCNTQLFNKSCYDISAGGMAFIVSKPESKFFALGDPIKPLKINVENKEIVVTGKVVNIIDVEPDAHNGLHYRGKKICVRYEAIDPNARKFLADFVFRHADLSQAV